MKEAGKDLRNTGNCFSAVFCCDVYRIFFQSGYESGSSSGAVSGEMA